MNVLAWILTIGLFRGGSISGRISDGAGNPIAGARVGAYIDTVSDFIPKPPGYDCVIDWDPEPEMAIGTETHSNSDGAFEFEWLRHPRHVIRVRAPGFQLEEWPGVAVGSRNIEFRLQRGGTFAGKVRTLDGRPIARARVSAYDAGKSNLLRIILGGFHPPLAVTETDEDGEYVFDCLSTGRYAFLIEAAGFQDALAKPVEVRGFPGEADPINLSPGLRLSGRVLDPLGQPLEGVRIEARDGGRPRREFWSYWAGRDEVCRSGPDGSFLFDTLHDRPCQIIAIPEDFAPIQLRDTTPREAPLEIRLAAGARVKGKVLDRRTKSPIAGARVWAKDICNVTRECLTDAKGQYLIRGLSVGRNGVRVVNAEKAGYTKTLDHVRIRNGEVTVDVDLEIDRDGSISGRISDGAGNPIAGAKVGAYGDIPDVRPTVGLGCIDIEYARRTFATPVETYSNDDGMFAFKGLTHPCYALRVHAGGFRSDGWRRVEAGSTKIDFRLEKGEKLSGTVRSLDGKPVLRASISAFAEGRTEDLVLLILDRMRPALAVAQTDDAGCYVFDSLSSGRYSFIIDAPGFQDALVENIEVRDLPAETEPISLSPALRLVGRVFDAIGQPLEGVRIEALALPKKPLPHMWYRAHGADVCRSGPDGSFLFDTLFDCPYQLLAAADDFAPVLLPEMTPGGPSLEIRLPIGACVLGRVFDRRTKAPIAGVRVWLKDICNITRECMTDPNGCYLIRGVSEGRQWVEVQKVGYVRGCRPVRVRDAEPTWPVDFRMDPE